MLEMRPPDPKIFSPSNPTIRHVCRCYLCGQDLPRQRTKLHLQRCIPRTTGARALLRNSHQNNEHTGIHLLAHNPPYRLDLAVDNSSTLQDLDQFLRNVWMECCQHISQFVRELPGAWSKNRTIYTSDFQRSGPPLISQAITEETFHNLAVPTKTLMPSKLPIKYEYDLGDTTNLTLVNLGYFLGLPDLVPSLQEHDTQNIRTIARNLMPELCWTCGEQAALCAVYDYPQQENPEPDFDWSPTWYCNNCAPADQRFRKLVNSPRDGLECFDHAAANQEPAPG